MTKINATLGFLFTPDFKKVLFIKKQKPAFHKDKLNGLGGKVERDESSVDCMVREVKEESGLATQKKEWYKVGRLKWQEWDVVLFTGVYKGKATDLKDLPEEVAWYSSTHLPENIISNITWLIPLCVDFLKKEKALNVRISYK